MAATVEPTRINLALYQGTTWRRTLTWQAGAPLAAVDLTDFTARLQVRSPFGGEPLLTLTEAAGLTLGGVAGTIGIEITAAQAEPLGPLSAPYLYDLRLVAPAPSNDVIRLVYGTVTVTPRVTVPA